jgi:hypothetical protein
MFSRKTPIDVFYSQLIDLEGAEKFRESCRQRGFPVAIGEYPQARRNDHWSRVERENGRKIDVMCVEPWMHDLFALRDDSPQNGDWTKVDAQKRLAWHTRLLKALDAKVDIAPILMQLGPERYFFSLSVQGFRTKDENGDLEYVGDTIGARDLEAGDGIFSKIAARYNLLPHEIYGRYLSEGY